MIHTIIQRIHIVHYSMDLEGLCVYKREMLSKTSEKHRRRKMRRYSKQILGGIEAAG